MTYQPREGVDAKTRDGRRITNIKLNDKNMTRQGYPWLGLDDSLVCSFRADGRYYKNYGCDPIDLVSDWEEPKEEPTVKDEINRRYECNGVKPDLPEGTMLTVWGGKSCNMNRSSTNMYWHNVTHYLIESYPKAKGWVNIYPNYGTTLYKTRELANNYADPNRIACIKVEWTEGDGL